MLPAAAGRGDVRWAAKGRRGDQLRASFDGDDGRGRDRCGELLRYNKSELVAVYEKDGRLWAMLVREDSPGIGESGRPGATGKSTRSATRRRAAMIRGCVSPSATSPSHGNRRARVACRFIDHNHPRSLTRQTASVDEVTIRLPALRDTLLGCDAYGLGGASFHRQTSATAPTCCSVQRHRRQPFRQPSVLRSSGT